MWKLRLLTLLIDLFPRDITYGKELNPLLRVQSYYYIDSTLIWILQDVSKKGEIECGLSDSSN